MLIQDPISPLTGTFADMRKRDLIGVEALPTFQSHYQYHAQNCWLNPLFSEAEAGKSLRAPVGN